MLPPTFLNHFFNTPVISDSVMCYIFSQQFFFQDSVSILLHYCWLKEKYAEQFSCAIDLNP